MRSEGSHTHIAWERTGADAEANPTGARAEVNAPACLLLKLKPDASLALIVLLFCAAPNPARTHDVHTQLTPPPRARARTTWHHTTLHASHTRSARP